MFAIVRRRARQWLEELPDSRLLSKGWRPFLRSAVVIFLISVSLTGAFLFSTPEGFSFTGYTSSYFQYFWNTTSTHPIDDLIRDAHLFHQNVLRERTFDVPSAAARYRERRGRHPPPGFEAWMEHAVEHGAIVVESFFDRIYADISPFWGIEPRITAERATTWEHVVRVRNGVVNATGNIEGLVPWLQLWSALVEEAAPFLPDVDMPINYMDESRLVVPWETVTTLVETEQASRSLSPVDETTTEYTGLSEMDVRREKEEIDRPPPNWLGGNYWDLTRVACAPDSLSRNMPPADTLETPPEFPRDWRPAYSYEGFVRNFTASIDPCSQPHLREMHGTFIEPLSMSTAQEMIPLFGGCKLNTNNDILIPGAMYLTDDPMYSGGDSHGPPWSQKTNGAVWRGVASGGRNKRENWTHFQRHRLVEMLNGTTVSHVEETKMRALTFEMPPAEKYDEVALLREGTLGPWIEEIANAGFTELLCFPAGECEYVEPYFSPVEGIPMKEQYKYKYMPDVDGNSFSARFRGFLLSTSLPIKSTIYAEWHDDRLVPWLHFVPMDNTFQDLYAILDYFANKENGDRSAQFIAEEGRAWGNQVLRREDMLLYVWRLLLEFARVCDEKRDRLGYVEDLKPVG
ncbi:glycosyltransferase family 90 protein [Xylariaceae sp. FL0255]|nr:glycosyltransferase family 90 protein [Xylariaceae sp. FL0255]